MNIFFSGIGGSGVSAIAGFLADKGHTVVGSDRLFDLTPEHPTKRRLEANGIRIVPQNGQGIDWSFDVAVFSTAIEKTNPDFLRSAELGIPIKTRPGYLAEIVAEYHAIAVAGTSGKSTTSGMLAFLMRELGMAPNFIGGGRVKQFKLDGSSGNYIIGGSDYLVIEACESDGTIVNYQPEHAVILNLELDHHTIDETAGMFEQLSQNTAGTILINADDPGLMSIGIRRSRTFSTDRDSNYRARDITHTPLTSEFSVNGQRFVLSLPGRHNLYNAVSSVALLSELGVSLKDISAVLPGFSGIERRFDIHFNDGRHIVIDDYAHNPHKIRNLMQTMQRIGMRVCYIFQPHGFGPTRMMKDGYISTFIDCLRDEDQLILLPIYYMGGTAVKDISSEYLSARIQAAGRNSHAVTNREEIFGLVQESDACVVFGARDDSLSDLADEIVKRRIF